MEIGRIGVHKALTPLSVDKNVTVGVIHVVGQGLSGVPIEFRRLFLGDDLDGDTEEFPVGRGDSPGCRSEEASRHQIRGVGPKPGRRVAGGSTVISMNTTLLPRPAAPTSLCNVMNAPVTSGHSSWQRVRKLASTMYFPR